MTNYLSFSFSFSLSLSLSLSSLSLLLFLSLSSIRTDIQALEHLRIRALSSIRADIQAKCGLWIDAELIHLRWSCFVRNVLVSCYWKSYKLDIQTNFSAITSQTLKWTFHVFVSIIYSVPTKNNSDSKTNVTIQYHMKFTEKSLLKANIHTILTFNLN